MRKIGAVAVAAAESILHYLTTRFPAGCDVPAHAIDAAWIADAIQKELDEDERRKRLAVAGDRRDWDECDRLEYIPQTATGPLGDL